MAAGRVRRTVLYRGVPSEPWLRSSRAQGTRLAGGRLIPRMRSMPRSLALPLYKLSIEARRPTRVRAGCVPLDRRRGIGMLTSHKQAVGLN